MLRTLIVPAGEFDSEAVVHSLTERYQTIEARQVDNAEELHALLANSDWDVILAGLSQGGLDARDALAARSGTKCPPVVVIAGAIGEEAVAAYIRAGAADFVHADRLEGLPDAIVRAVEDAEATGPGAAGSCRVVSSLPQTVAETDLTGKLTLVNDNAFTMFGYDREDLEQGLHVTKMIAPEDRDRASARIDQMIRTREMGSGEYLALRKDGTTFHALINSAPLICDGKPVGLRSIVVDISDRVEAEEALRESEERYRTLVENMHEGVWAVDADGVTTFVNDRVTEMLGYDAEQILGRHFWEFQPEEVARGAREDLRTGFGGRPRTVPRTFITSSGEMREALVRPVPLLDEDGRLRSAFATVVDITERVRIERERRQTLLKFRTLFDQLNDPVFIHDLDGRFVEVNDAACARLGYTRGELLQMGPKELDIAGYAGAVDRKIQQLLEHGEGCFQTAHITRAGNIVPVELNSRVIEYDGQPHVVSIARDISSRLEAARRFRTIFDAAGTAMVIVDEDGTIAEMNWGFCQLSGYDADEVEESMHWKEFVAEADVERLTGYGSKRRGGVGDPPSNYEFDFVDREGTVKRVLCTVSIIPGTNQTVASLLDISDRLALESQLRQAQKMKAIGDLAGGVAHDFNNNLTAILVSIQLLRHEEDGLSPGVAEAMDVIESAAKRSASLTRQLLAFGRKQFMEPESFGVCELVRGMRPMLERVIPECIAIETAPRNCALQAHMDPSQLEHVIMNLVVNARDAMPSGGTITIGVDVAEIAGGEQGGVEPGEYVQLSVSDTGVGMDEETQTRIFEPFFTTRGEADGAGLGLSTAYGIVRQSGGDITVTSEPGIGTTFRVFLPIAADCLAPGEAVGGIPDESAGNAS